MSSPAVPGRWRLVRRAAPRVVLKLPRGAPAPDALGGTRRVRGKEVDYAVYERSFDAPAALSGAAPSKRR